jgi:hypothetical protein
MSLLAVLQDDPLEEQLEEPLREQEPLWEQESLQLVLAQLLGRHELN